MIHRSPLANVEIPEVLLPELVLRRVTELPDKPALIDGPSGRVITYAQLDDSVRRLAGGLVAGGFAPGDVVAVMAPNLLAPPPGYCLVMVNAGLDEQLAQAPADAG